MIVGSNGNGCIERGLLDKWCSKSIIPKKNTKKKQWNNMEEKDLVNYQTYDGKFKSSFMVSVGFWLVEFEGKMKAGSRIQVSNG